MRINFAIAAAALAAIAALLILQQRTTQRLRAEQSLIQARTAEVETLRAENKRLAQTAADTEELDRLRGEHQELLRLRAEVTRLRREGRGQPDAGPRRRGGAASVPTPPPAATVSTTELEKFQQSHTEIVNAMKQLGLAARIYSVDNEDRLPTTFDQMQTELPASLGGGVELSQFEFMPHSRPIEETEPNVILFRERTARQRPDGRWVRAYTLVDGSVQTAIVDDGNFEPWEAKHREGATPAQ